jgi:hypothetical protein
MDALLKDIFSRINGVNIEELTPKFGPSTEVPIDGEKLEILPDRDKQLFLLCRSVRYELAMLNAQYQCSRSDPGLADLAMKLGADLNLLLVMLDRKLVYRHGNLAGRLIIAEDWGVYNLH